MRNFLIKIKILIGIFILSVNVFSQSKLDSTKLFQITDVNGNKYIGNILNQDADSMKLLTGNMGTLTFQISDIKKYEKLDKGKIVKGRVWVENPQPGRYFWSPSGYGLKKGEGYYQNIWVWWNQASIGFTDNFSVGTIIIPFMLSKYTPLFIVPKFSIPIVKDKINVGAGILAGTLGFQKNTGFGIAYGVGTFGDRNKNLTFGLGYGYAAGNWASTPLINISAMARLSSKTYFLTENYYIGIGDEWLAFLSGGARSILGKVALDYGVFVPIFSELEVTFPFPWLGLTVPFQLKGLN